METTNSAPPSQVTGLVPLDDHNRDFSDSILPEAMIFAGMDALERAQGDLDNYVSGETIDWDNGMIAVAVYRAMTHAVASDPWLDMKTAPTTPHVRNPAYDFVPPLHGPMVLLLIDWDAGLGEPSYETVVGWWSPSDRCWRHTSDDGAGDTQPVAWMPLPAPRQIRKV